MPDTHPPTPGSTNGTAPAPEGAGILALVAVLLRRRGLIIGVAATLEIALLIYALQMPAWYTAGASFVPESQSQTSSVSAIAAQFGVAVSAPSGMNSIQFYPELVRSPQFVANILETRYAPDSATPGQTLIELYDIKGGSPAQRRSLAAEQLNESMTIVPVTRTGIVTVTVTADQPWLASAITTEILRRINDFNLHTRQSRASAERKFVEKRLAETRIELRSAEDKLQQFLQANRDYQRSPTLQFEYSRQQREISFLSQLTMSLATSFEQSKIDEVRDTPVITILRAPEPPIKPDPRGRVKMLLGGLVGGLALGILVALALDMIRRWRREETPEVLELSELSDQLRADLSKGRLIRALIGPRQQ